MTLNLNLSSQTILIWADWQFSSTLLKYATIANMPIVVVMLENRLLIQAIPIYNNWEIMDKNLQSCHNTNLELPQLQSIKEYFVHARLFLFSSFSHLLYVCILINVKYADTYEYQSAGHQFSYKYIRWRHLKMLHQFV